MVNTKRVRLESATKALNIIATRFKESESRLSPFNDFDAVFSRSSDSSSVADVELTLFVERLKAIARNVFFLERVISSKICLIVQGANSSLQQENLLVLAYCTRALVEHAASAAWLQEKCEKFERELSDKNNPKILNGLFEKFEGRLRDFYFNNDGKGQLVHVNEMLEVLSHRVPNQAEIYNRLCDYLHPNYGSNLMVSSGELGTGRLNQGVLWRIEDAENLVTTCIRVISVIKKINDDIGFALVSLKDLVDRASVGGVRFSNWLSVRKSSPQGDGKSIEAPLWFPKARTGVEAMSMFGGYCRELGLNFLGNSIESIDDEWVITRIETDQGNLWLKCPVAHT